MPGVSRREWRRQIFSVPLLCLRRPHCALEKRDMHKPTKHEQRVPLALALLRDALNRIEEGSMFLLNVFTELFRCPSTSPHRNERGKRSPLLVPYELAIKKRVLTRNERITRNKHRACFPIR